jgi:hypothetical protein
VGDVGLPLSFEAQHKALRRQRMRVPTASRTPDEVKVCNAKRKKILGRSDCNEYLSWTVSTFQSDE